MTQHNDMEDRPGDGGQQPDSLPALSFDDLTQSMRQAAERMRWTELMPVQAQAIPYVLSGRDVMVQSRTGSGKTGAFVLPILEGIDPSLDVCQAMVLTPTRELASQVASDAEAMSAGTGIRVLPVYGGVGYGPQTDALRRGVHLVVGTPGRILDHLLRRTFTLEHLRFLVFDEADRMLSIGFYPDMKEVQRYLPRRRVHTVMFSATFPPHVMRLAGEFLTEPSFLSLSGGQIHVAEIEHDYFVIPGMDKDRVLVRLIEIENPASAMIFCNTKANVHYVAAVLQGFGYDADEISADLSQSRREEVLARVRSGRLRLLVATDVAARGIDIPELSHVFLYDVPEDHETYIHRAGRTGRAGASGTVMTFVDLVEELELKRIAARYKIDFQQRTPPGDEDVAAVVAERLTASLEAKLRSLKSLQVERIKRFVPLAKSLAQGEDEPLTLAMLLDEQYRAALGEPAPRPAPLAPQSPSAARPPRREAAEPPRAGGGTSDSGPSRNRRRRRRKPSGGAAAADGQPS